MHLLHAHVLATRPWHVELVARWPRPRPPGAIRALLVRALQMQGSDGPFDMPCSSPKRSTPSVSSKARACSRLDSIRNGVERTPPEHPCVPPPDSHRYHPQDIDVEDRDLSGGGRSRSTPLREIPISSIDISVGWGTLGEARSIPKWVHRGRFPAGTGNPRIDNRGFGNGYGCEGTVSPAAKWRDQADDGGEGRARRTSQS